MRRIEPEALRLAAEARFRSEYHYALFEYLRSAKVIETLERAGVVLAGRVLDSGCGGGGTIVSLAEEVRFGVGLDLDARFAGAGTRLVTEKRLGNVAFVRGDGQRLPFADATFDLILSHSVIEHVTSAETYLAECLRVLRPGGRLYLSTAPYLSFAGAHLPRLKVPIPLHLLLGRRAAFAIFCWLGAHWPRLLREGREANTFIALASKREVKHDDLRQHVTLRRLEGWIARSGLRCARAEHHVTGFFRRCVPSAFRRLLSRAPVVRDVMVGHIQLVLEKP